MEASNGYLVNIDYSIEMFRTFDLAWSPAISAIVEEHLNKTAHLQQYGYSKTNLSNVKKNTYYRSKYSAARKKLIVVSFESDTPWSNWLILRTMYVVFTWSFTIVRI